MDELLLSVVIPVYNVEKYLVECFNSIINQSFEKLEIILVDDGSTDKSGEICDLLQKNRNNVIVIHQSNQGLPEARNSGIRAAKGKYISFIDSDDYVDKTMYETMISTLEKDQSDMVVCNFALFDKKTVKPLDNHKNCFVSFDEHFSTRFYSFAFDGCTNKLFKREIIVNNGIWFESKKIVPQEDYYFEIKYLTFCSRISSLSNPFYYYRKRISSITNTIKQTDNVLVYYKLIDLSKKFISKHSCRKIEDFLEYEKMMLLLTSLNHIETRFKTIKNLYRIYRFGDKRIFKKVCFFAFGEKNLRNRYFRFIFSLARCDFMLPVLILERARLVRTKKKVDKKEYDDFYE